MEEPREPHVSTEKPGRIAEPAGWSVPGGAGLRWLLSPTRHFRLHCCPEEIPRSGDCDIVFFQGAYLEIVRHLAEDTSREHGGLLLGHILRSDDGSPPTVVVTSSLRAQFTRGTRTSLTFTEETWLRFQQETDELERNGGALQRLGWYHSHPGLTIFLSSWDLDVCSNFTQPHHLALVVDPIGDEGGFFIMGEEGYRSRIPQGFWEPADETPRSVVTWKNMREVRWDRMIPAFAYSPVSLAAVPQDVPSPQPDAQTVAEEIADGAAEAPLQDTPAASQDGAAEPAPPAEEDLAAEAGAVAIPQRDQEKETSQARGPFHRLRAWFKSKSPANDGQAQEKILEATDSPSRIAAHEEGAVAVTDPSAVVSDRPE